MRMLGAKKLRKNRYSNMKKNESRLRRARKSRSRMRTKKMTRLSVHRTTKHIYAQIISSSGDSVLASASTLDKSLRDNTTGNINAAEAVGKLVAERALKVGVKKIAFDRGGFKFHGRVKALADSARENGLEF